MSLSAATKTMSSVAGIINRGLNFGVTAAPSQGLSTASDSPDDISRQVFVAIEYGDRRISETIEFSPRYHTVDDLLGAIYAAAEIPPSQQAALSLALESHTGETPPINTTLPANQSTQPYRVVIRSRRDTLEIDKELQKLSLHSGSVADVVHVKESVKSAFKKVEKLDIDKVAMPKPYGLVQKPARKAWNDKWLQMEPRYTMGSHVGQQLRRTTFDSWQYDENEMVVLFETIFEGLGIQHDFDVEASTLRRFLLTVRDHYRTNPFHNFRHAFCVTQMMYAIINEAGLIDRLRPQEKLILAIACVGHDLEHPGYNNSYQINAKTDLAILYNDIAPLEMHHAAVLFQILKIKDCNILSRLDDKTYREVRKAIIRCILSTDMAKHGEILSDFKKISDSFDYKDNEHRSQLLSIIVKCSDISNEVRPPDVSEPWVDSLLEEFFAQSDREKAEGLPTAPFMDREKVTKATAQIGFIGYVMFPLYELLAKVLPEAESCLLEPLKASLNFYKEMLNRGERPRDEPRS